MDANTRIEHSEAEKPMSVNWVVSPDISRDLNEGSVKIIESINNFNPDLVVVLKRSGSLVYYAVEEMAEEKGKALPQNIDIQIGRELSDPFLDEDRDFQIFTQEDWKDFDKYLNSQANDPNSQVSEIVSETKSKVLPINPKRIFVVDDSSFGEATLKHTAPFILKKALGDDVVIESGLIFEHNNGWLTGIIRDTFKPEEFAERQDIGNITALLSMLAKGEYEEGEWNLKTGGKIVNWETVEMLGKKIVDNPIFGEVGRENPAQILKKRFDTSVLLGLHNSLILALQGVVLGR